MYIILLLGLSLYITFVISLTFQFLYFQQEQGRLSTVDGPTVLLLVTRKPHSDIK